MKLKAQEVIKKFDHPNLYDLIVNLQYDLTTAKKVGLYLNKEGLIKQFPRIPGVKNEKLEDSELEDSELENLILKSKDFVNKGNKYYSKKDYIEAVNNWDKAIETFESTLEVTASSSRKEIINENIKSIRERIYKAYIEKGITTDLLIKREYEFIGGQVRFKIALKNKTLNPLTNLKITFDIPKALKWIRVEPNYEYRGDTIFIPKLGKKEKKVVSLYLEPINCLESPINATLSFHDARDRPQATTMEPKMVSITCPIFFTEEEANLARVKNLQRKLNHQDKKVFPIVNPKKISFIFETALSILGRYDIKLVSKEFSEKNKFDEAWYYATTKVGKNKLVGYIVIDASKKTLEFRVSGDNKDQITAFLAEIGSGIRERLIKHDVISMDDNFYDMSASVLSNICPYCGDKLSYELVQEYLGGQQIKCKYCYVEITKSEQ